MTETVEQEIQRKGLTAPRVTPEDLEAEIIGQDFAVLTDTLTVCVLTLANGFTVTGESACASPENFNAEVGRRIARDNAKQKIWPLLGFRLRDKLKEAAMPKPTDAYDRIELELHFLSEKLIALTEFIDTDTYRSLSERQRTLLIEQRRFMAGYQSVLEQRLQAWDETPGTDANGSPAA
jgi:hypothetical protein